MSHIKARTLFLGSCLCIAACSSAQDGGSPTAGTKDVPPQGAAGTTTCAVDQDPGREFSDGDRSVGIKVTELYREYSGQCPTQEQVDELRYIWLENEEYWVEFPAQVDLFFTANVKDGLGEAIQGLIGLSFEEASAALTSDEDFPMTQDRGPTMVREMVFYEFSGGMSGYLLVVRREKVTSIYFFDQA